MSTALLKRPRLQISHGSAGIHLSAAEFDCANLEEGWRYELIDGVLVVSTTPLEAERDPNEELGHWLRTYQEAHAQGHVLDKTLPEHMVITSENRRSLDRILWIGLGRLPTPEDDPTILVEFVSEGKRNWLHDYEEKRDEYLAINVKEYWIIDRFDRTLTVFSKQGKRVKKRIVAEDEIFTTPLLPGFDLALAKLLKLADDWESSKRK